VDKVTSAASRISALVTDRARDLDRIAGPGLQTVIWHAPLVLPWLDARGTAARTRGAGDLTRLGLVPEAIGRNNLGLN
jgi:hypothetical protein